MSSGEKIRVPEREEEPQQQLLTQRTNKKQKNNRQIKARVSPATPSLSS